MTHYTTHGPVRGSCGHRHRSIRTAQLCADRDHAAVGSDREVYRLQGSKRLPLSEDECFEADYYAEVFS